MKIIVNLLLLTLFNVTAFGQSIEEQAARVACECAKSIRPITHNKYVNCVITSLEKIFNNQYGKFNYSYSDEEITNITQKTDSIIKSICDSTIFIELKKIDIDGVYFSYYPMNHYPLMPFKFKFYKDTLYVNKFDINDDDYTLCQKIINHDTLNFIKEFIRLFITDKTEKIILKAVEEPESLYKDHTSVIIREYRNREITFDEDIVIYPEEEYHPKFLQLVEMFYGIAVAHSNKEEKKE